MTYRSRAGRNAGNAGNGGARKARKRTKRAIRARRFNVGGLEFWTPPQYVLIERVRKALVKLEREKVLVIAKVRSKPGLTAVIAANLTASAFQLARCADYAEAALSCMRYAARGKRRP